METLYKKYVLRRTQAEEGAKCSRLALPSLQTQVKYLEFQDDKEKLMYKEVETWFQEQVVQGDKSAYYNTAIEGIIRCRQICTHPKIYLEGCEKKEQKTKVRKRRVIHDDDNPRDSKSSKIPGSGVYDDSSNIKSTKVEFLCQDILDNAVKQKSKCLIFCTWVLEMKFIQQALWKQNVASLIFDGSLSRDGKDTVLYNFKNSVIPVLILQINCGSTGLNLQCASRVYIMSPNWNPCVEVQAIGRAYRKGQVNRVSCVRLVMKDTIEEKCLKIQNKKTAMIMDTMADNSIQAKLGALAEEVLSPTDIDELFKPAQGQQNEDGEAQAEEAEEAEEEIPTSSQSMASPSPTPTPSPMPASTPDPFEFPASPSALPSNITFPDMMQPMDDVFTDDEFNTFLEEFLADAPLVENIDDLIKDFIDVTDY
jgi:SNF2 family DNA or RNA helicase